MLDLSLPDQRSILEDQIFDLLSRVKAHVKNPNCHAPTNSGHIAALIRIREALERANCVNIRMHSLAANDGPYGDKK